MIAQSMKSRAQTGRAGAGFQTFSAWVVYAALSVFFFGLPIIGHLSETHIGGGTDPICHIWAIAWWPYAIAHRLNPLMTHALWAPAGYNLVWGTDIPGPSLVIYPVTRIFGPVVSYNLLCLLAPPAAAVSAFLLCRYVCGGLWPALLGGYIFGFSPYVLCHMLAHLALILIFPIPLAVYVTLLRTDAKIGRVGFIGSLTAILLFQFLCSTEIFATATIFGAIALGLGFVLAEKEMRLTLLNVAKEIACAFAFVTILLVPYLYYVFVPGLPNPPNPATVYSNDLLTFVLPPPVVLVGPHFVSGLGHFFANTPWWEQTAYLGPGLWTVMLLFAGSYWRMLTGKVLILSFVVIAIMSLGPELQAWVRPLLVMPWRLFNKLPLMDEALPGRFGMYLFLIAAVGAAIYLGRASGSFAWKAMLTGFSLLFIAPEPSIWQQTGRVPAFLGTPGQSRIHVPAFFRSAQYKRYLEPGDNELILPLGSDGSNTGLLWQAQSDFYFNTTDWFGAIAPPDSSRWPIMAAFHSEVKIFDFSEQLDGFLGAHQVKAIIIDSRAPGRWPELLSGVGMSAAALDGVLLYKVPPAVLASFRGATVHQMAQKYASASFAAVVSAAKKYVDGGFPLTKLSPSEVQRLHLLSLPDSQIRSGGDSNWWQNLWLGSRGGLIGVGIVGNYQDLEFLIDKYRREAVRTFFPFPKPLSKRHRRGDGLLLITFTSEGLRRAASKANNPARIAGMDAQLGSALPAG